MIALRNLTQTVGKGKRSRELLSDVNFVFHEEHLGLVVESAENAEIVIDLLAGIRRPETGKIWRSGRASWPIGRVVQYRADLTGKATLHFFASIYGLPIKSCEDIVFGLINIEKYYNKPLIGWPRDILLQFSYATALIPNFDIYIVDSSISTSDELFMNDWEGIFREKINGRQLIYFSNNETYMSKYVTRAVSLIEGNFFLFDEVSTAFKAIGPISDRSAGDAVRDQEEDTAAIANDFGV